MKYYLIIGYQITDKHKEFPDVRVSIDNNFIDEFACDNEDSIQMQTSAKYIDSFTEDSKAYGYNRTREITYEFRSPKKYKLLELESAQWQSNSKMKIEITNNKSNYMNGFMTKSSTVTIAPVFLINKDLLHNKKAMHRLISYREWSDTKVEWNTRQLWYWPGINRYHKSTSSPEHDETYCRGGNFTLEFDIIKKHNTHILTVGDIMPRGIFFIPPYFRAWYSSFTNEKILLQTHTDCNINLPQGVRQPGLSGTAHIVVTKDDQNK